MPTTSDSTTSSRERWQNQLEVSAPQFGSPKSNFRLGRLLNDTFFAALGMPSRVPLNDPQDSLSGCVDPKLVFGAHTSLLEQPYQHQLIQQRLDAEEAREERLRTQFKPSHLPKVLFSISRCGRAKAEVCKDGPEDTDKVKSKIKLWGDFLNSDSSSDDDDTLLVGRGGSEYLARNEKSSRYHSMTGQQSKAFKATQNPFAKTDNAAISLLQRIRAERQKGTHPTSNPTAPTLFHDSGRTLSTTPFHTIHRPWTSQTHMRRMEDDVDNDRQGGGGFGKNSPGSNAAKNTEKHRRKTNSNRVLKSSKKAPVSKSSRKAPVLGNRRIL
jgi:hypothetical protein